MLSVADFILAICWMLGGALWLQKDAEHYFGFCYFLAIITVVCFMKTKMFMLCNYTFPSVTACTIGAYVLVKQLSLII